MGQVAVGGKQSLSVVPRDWIVSMVEISGMARLEKKPGKNIRRRGRMAARPTAKRDTPGSTVYQITIPSVSPD